MYEEARHEALIEEDWDEDRAVRVIDEIVRDTRERFDQHRLWPIHPLDKFRDNLTEHSKCSILARRELFGLWIT